jgi:hypothetical protein
MRNRLTKTTFLWFLALTLTLAIGVITPRPALALNVYDYFVINYDTEFSQTVIGEGDVFQATISGTADCTQDMPLTVSKGYITSRVVAQHRESDLKATLNPSYTIHIEPFPNEAGETAEANVVISLSFPSGSPAGTYDIAGELIEAKVWSTPAGWLPVTPYLPAVEELGTVSYQPGDEDFTIPAPAPAPKPANFAVTNLTIAPTEAKPGEEITISVLAANTGDLEGTCSVILKIAGTVVTASNITLTGDSNQRVTFTIQKDTPGTYDIDVNGLAGTFTVEGAAPGSLNWWLIGGIIAAAAAAIAIPLALRKRRRGV